MAPHVLRELIDGGVAPRRLLAERFEDDVVQIAGQPAAKQLAVSGTERVVGRRCLRPGAFGDVTSVRAGRRAAVGQLGDRGTGANRFRFAHDPRDVGGRPAGQAVGQPSGEQLVEEHPQRVDIRRRGHRLAAHLLGARVLGRHQLESRGRGGERVSRQLRIEQLGDAEVEQLGCAVGRDQDVGGLDVPMDDQVLVGVLDRRADQPEELQPRRGVHPSGVAILDDRLSLDVLHREVRQSVRRRAAVEEAGDVRVLEAGEDLAFVPEPSHDGVAVHAALEHLDRDALLERIVIADAEMHGAHAAVPDLANEAIGPDTRVAVGQARRRGQPRDLVVCRIHRD